MNFTSARHTTKKKVGCVAIRKHRMDHFDDVKTSLGYAIKLKFGYLLPVLKYTCINKPLQQNNYT